MVCKSCVVRQVFAALHIRFFVFVKVGGIRSAVKAASFFKASWNCK